MNKEQIRKMCEQYAAQKRDILKLNPDEKIVDMIITGLLKNEEKHGFIYCPCRPVTGNKEEDIPKICPCDWHLDEIKKDGKCLCKLFVKA